MCFSNPVVVRGLPMYHLHYEGCQYCYTKSCMLIKLLCTIWGNEGRVAMTGFREGLSQALLPFLPYSVQYQERGLTGRQSNQSTNQLQCSAACLICLQGRLILALCVSASFVCLFCIPMWRRFAYLSLPFFTFLCAIGLPNFFFSLAKSFSLLFCCRKS